MRKPRKQTFVFSLGDLRPRRNERFANQFVFLSSSGESADEIIRDESFPLLSEREIVDPRIPRASVNLIAVLQH